MRSFARPIVAALLLASTMPVVLAQPSQPQRLYNEALERERGLRKDLESAGANTTVLIRVRALVGAYEDMSKLFPTPRIPTVAIGSRLRRSAQT